MFYQTQLVPNLFQEDYLIRSQSISHILAEIPDFDKSIHRYQCGFNFPEGYSALRLE